MNAECERQKQRLERSLRALLCLGLLILVLVSVEISFLWSSFELTSSSWQPKGKSKATCVFVCTCQFSFN